MVIWITGLSGSGKTTLCNSLGTLLKSRIPELVVLDGDQVRAAFGNDLSYREEDRMIQIKRLQKIAKLLSTQKMVVLVAALYSHPELLDWNRQNLESYFEIYLKASLETVRCRDVKGLYAKALSGEIADVVGIDVPWHAPESPDLVVNADDAEEPEVIARRVIAATPLLAQALE